MTKVEKIRQLLAATPCAADMVIESLRKTPNLVRVFMAEPGFAVEIRASFVDLLVPFFDKHLSDRTLDAAFAYHTSPEGLDFAKAQRAMDAETRQGIAQWSSGIQQRLSALMAKHGK